MGGDDVREDEDGAGLAKGIGQVVERVEDASAVRAFVEGAERVRQCKARMVSGSGVIANRTVCSLAPARIPRAEHGVGVFDLGDPVAGGELTQR